VRRHEGAGHVVRLPPSPLCFVAGADRSAASRLAATAFREVLGTKQSRYPAVITWLKRKIESAAPREEKERVRLGRVIGGKRP